MPAQGYGANLKLPPAPPIKNLPPTKTAQPARLPGAPTPSFKGGLPKTFEGAPKLERANARAPMPRYEPPPRQRGGGILGDAARVGTTALATIVPGFGAAAATNPIAKTVAEAGVKKGEAVGAALVKDPGATLSATASSVPKTFNALATGTARLGVETLAEVMAAQGKGRGEVAPPEVMGIKPGKPGEALSRVAEAAVNDVKNRYGKSTPADTARIEKEGFLPEALDATTLLGSPVSVAGRAISKGIEKAGAFSGDAAKAVAYRDAMTHALQAPNVTEFLRRKDLVPPAPTKGEARRAFMHESAALPRPDLRTGVGSDAGVGLGHSVQHQSRSPNFFRAAVGTTVDNTRRAYQQSLLQRALDVRQGLDPNLGHENMPVPHVQQLAYDTKRAEVTPIFQRGGLELPGGLNKFVGAEKAQRVGAASIHGAGVEGRRGEVDPMQHTYNKLLNGLTPEQRKIVNLGKEGRVSLSHPKQGLEHLKEVRDQALEGKSPFSSKQLREGQSVSREVGSVIKHMEKHGPESVINPQFEKAVQTMPDSTLTAHRNPVLQDTPRSPSPAVEPDLVAMRRLSPQMLQTEQWAIRHEASPIKAERELAAQTKAVAEHYHQLVEQGVNTRRVAVASSQLPKGWLAKLESHPEAQAYKDANAAVVRAEIALRRVSSGRTPGSAKEVGGANASGVASAKAGLQAAKAARAVAARDVRSLAKNPLELHARADNKFANAKNLADENALQHGLPTDRAYVEHTQTTRRDEARLHTVGNFAPADVHRWTGAIQKSGRMSMDPRLPFKAAARDIRNDYTQRAVNEFHQRYNVAPRADMTGPQVQRWLEATGRDPSHYEIRNLGKFREAYAGHILGAQNMPHFAVDPGAHAVSMQHLWDHSTLPDQTTKGAGAYLRAAWGEQHSSFGTTSGRVLGKLKGLTSKEMLGTSLPWATTMSLLTYPSQALAAGGGPLSAIEAVRWYRGMSPADKALTDKMFGVDSAFQSSSHGYTADRLGSQKPESLDEVARMLRIAKESPVGRALKTIRPDEAVLKFERTPRRYARITVAYKGVKKVAMENMWREMQGVQRDMSTFERGTAKVQNLGKVPPERYMQAAMRNVPAMEHLAQHLNNAMGEWQKMTSFERNHLNKWIMFYPWLRYSLRLAFKTLPAHHPLAYALALKLGTWEHNDLKELLGTEPTPGNVYLGKAQPEVAPEERQFSTMKLAQANPLLNSAVTLLGAPASQALDALPPYFSAVADYLYGRSSFTGKNFKGDQLGESKEEKGSPPFFPYFAQHLASTFSPARAATEMITQGRPQATGSAPLFGDEKRVQYSPKTERKIAQESQEQGKGGLISTLYKDVFPNLPHSDQGALAGKIRTEAREAKEAKKNARKKMAREGKLPPLEPVGEARPLPKLPSLPPLK